MVLQILIAFYLGGAVAIGGVMLTVDDEDDTRLFLVAVFLWPIAIVTAILYPEPKK